MSQQPARLQHVIQNYRNQLANREQGAEQALQEAYVRALSALQPELDKLYQQIDAKQKAGEPISPSWFYEEQRLDRLKQFLGQELATLKTPSSSPSSPSPSGKPSQSILGRIKQFIANTFNHFAQFARIVVEQLQHQGVSLGKQVAQAQMQTIIDLPQPMGNYVFSSPSPDAIAALVGATQAGSPLADLFRGFGNEAAQNVGQALINGVALGRSAQDVARDVQLALNITRARAFTVARTELLRAYRGASLETYRANSALVGQWRWSASKSGRTCAACIAMDGTLHDLSEDFGSHPNCRCSPIPVPADSQFQYPYQGGEDWLKEQSEEVQKQVLGAKYDGWSNGDFSLSDLVGVSHSSDWGTSIYVKSLKQVKAA